MAFKVSQMRESEKSSAQMRNNSLVLYSPDLKSMKK